MNLQSLLIYSLAVGACFPALAAESRPSFLIIQCDDLGWDDIGCNNPLVHTPNIDQLSGDSVTFSNFTVNPVCAPSRATFLTGRHFLRTGVSHVHGGKDYLRLEERTLGDHFRAAGYATGIWGKWHLGDSPGYYPWERGFQEAYKARLYRHEKAGGSFNGNDVVTEKWADEVMADYAIGFLQRHRTQPFFAYLPTMTPHAPHAAPERWVSFYTDRGIPPALAKIWGMVSFLDEQLGRVLAELEQLGLTERTVVVLMSDNGPAVDRNALSDAERELRRTSGLRGWKGDLFENGVRSPLMIRWPGTLVPGRINAPEDLGNLAPTLLELAGLSPVPDSPPMDGRSFAARLRAGAEREGDAPIFNYAHRGWLTSGPPYSLEGIPGEYAPGRLTAQDFSTQTLSVRRGRFKLIRNPEFSSSREEHLFDVVADPGEKIDLSGDHPEIRQELSGLLREWWGKITTAPGAFEPPLFPLKTGENSVPARAPSRLQGSLVNTVMGLKDWKTAGDAASYRVRLAAPGRAAVHLSWKADSPPQADWECAVNDIVSRPDATGRATVELPAGESELCLRLCSEPPPEGLPILKTIEISIAPPPKP